MIVPNETIFSNNPWGDGNITYGDARELKDNKKKIEATKARLDVLLFNQIKPIAKHDENYAPAIWSPFPLAALTFLGIETLGRVIGDKEQIEKDNFKTSKKFSKPIYKLIDSKLINKPNKLFYKHLEKRLSKNDKKNIDSYSDVIHKYMRNTYTHGFQGLLVYLNHQLREGWIIKDGYIILNPYWFWDRFYDSYTNIFNELINKPEKNKFNNVIKYFDDLIK